MKKVLNVFICSILFIVFFDTALRLKNITNSNVLYQSKKKESTQLNKNAIYFLGDSYAATSYVENSFPTIFEEYSISNNYGFYDLSKNGSEFNYNKLKIDSLLINKRNSDVILYFFNINDIRDITPDSFELALNADKNNNDVNYLLECLKIIRQSEVFKYFADILNHVSMLTTKNIFPYSNSYNFTGDSYRLYGNTILEKFNQWDQLNVRIIILINYPFKYNLQDQKNWFVYSFFDEMKNYENIEIYQVMDIMEDFEGEKLSISWRNEHPNQQVINHIGSNVIRILNIGGNAKK